jgi:hypothetical protein
MQIPGALIRACGGSGEVFAVGPRSLMDLAEQPPGSNDSPRAQLRSPAT